MSKASSLFSKHKPSKPPANLALRSSRALERSLKFRQSTPLASTPFDYADLNLSNDPSSKHASMRRSNHHRCQRPFDSRLRSWHCISFFVLFLTLSLALSLSLSYLSLSLSLSLLFFSLSLYLSISSSLPINPCWRVLLSLGTSRLGRITPTAAGSPHPIKFQTQGLPDKQLCAFS